jgi:hypothetical protein
VLWVWLAALISAAYTLGNGASWAAAELGLLPARGIWLPITLLVPAVLIALVVAAIARFGGVDLRAVAACGLAGPALVGLSYLIAGPGGGNQTTAYRYALLAICAGFAVSALAAVARRRRPARRTTLPEPGPTAEPPPARDPAPESETAPTGLSATDYGWPEPEPDAADPTFTDLKGIEPEPRKTEAATATSDATALDATVPETASGATAPVKATKAASRRRAPAKAAKAAAAPTQEPPPRPEPAKPAPTRATDPAARTTEPTVQTTDPASKATEPPTPEPVAADKPAKATRLGRRGRRDPESQPAKVAKPARVSKAEARENDHIDWVKSLGGGPSIRVGGTESARHARSADGLDPLDDDV